MKTAAAARKPPFWGISSLLLLLLLLLIPATALLGSNELLLGVCGLWWGWAVVVVVVVITLGIKVHLLSQVLDLLSWQGTRVLDHAVWLLLTLTINLGAIRLVVRWFAVICTVLVCCRCACAHIRHLESLAIGDLIVGRALPFIVCGRAVALWMSIGAVSDLIYIWELLPGKLRTVCFLFYLTAFGSPLLWGSICECLAVVRLASGLSCALLFLTTDKCTVRHRCIVTLLWLIVEALWALSFLDSFHSIIIIIALKKLLNARSLKLGLILEHLFRVGILPFAVRVFCIKIVFLGRRGEWRSHSFLFKRVPVKPVEPSMLS